MTNTDIINTIRVILDRAWHGCNNYPCYMAEKGSGINTKSKCQCKDALVIHLRMLADKIEKEGIQGDKQ